MNRRLRRNGATITEAVIAVGLAAAVLAGVARLAALTTQQRRVADQRVLAAREAANVMEQVASRPWSEITAQRLASIEPSDRCRQRLPDARLQIAVQAENESERIKRIEIRLDWLDAAGRRGPPVHLVAWRFGRQEEQ